MPANHEYHMCWTLHTVSTQEEVVTTSLTEIIHRRQVKQQCRSKCSCRTLPYAGSAKGQRYAPLWALRLPQGLSDTSKSLTKLSWKTAMTVCAVRFSACECGSHLSAAGMSASSYHSILCDQSQGAQGGLSSDKAAQKESM